MQWPLFMDLIGKTGQNTNGMDIHQQKKVEKITELNYREVKMRIVV